MLFTSEKEAAKNGCIITGNDADWECIDCHTKNEVVVTGLIGRMCQRAIVKPMVLSIRTTMKMVSGNLKF